MTALALEDAHSWRTGSNKALAVKRAKSCAPLSLANNSLMGLRYLPMAFTEQGVAMLSSVLRSKRAISVNIQIMRAFTQLRQMLLTHEDLKKKIENMESKYDHQFKVVFEAIKQLLTIESRPKRRSGFEVKEPKAPYKKQEG